MDDNDLVIRTTAAFAKLSAKLMSEEALADMYAFLLENPSAGDIISGSGGVRKLRWQSGLNNKGKSGGVRIIYHYSSPVLVLLLDMYRKNDKEDLTQAERNAYKERVETIVKFHLEAMYAEKNHTIH